MFNKNFRDGGKQEAKVFLGLILSTSVFGGSDCLAQIICYAWSFFRLFIYLFICW